ncbi:hypothetical protein SKPI104516_09600 [Skermania piniformis]
MIVVLLVVDLLLFVALLGFVARLRRRGRELTESVAELTAADPPLRINPVFAAGRNRLITIEVLNPVQLAAGQNRFAGLAGAVAPDLVQQIVYDQAAAIMRQQLAEQGVQADVRVHVDR